MALDNNEEHFVQRYMVLLIPTWKKIDTKILTWNTLYRQVAIHLIFMQILVHIEIFWYGKSVICAILKLLQNDRAIKLNG